MHFSRNWKKQRATALKRSLKEALKFFKAELLKNSYGFIRTFKKNKMAPSRLTITKFSR